MIQVADFQPVATPRRRYYLSLGVLFVSLALLLFTVVDIRRAFLFPLSGYYSVGFPSSILHFDLRHFPLLLLAGLGILLAYGSMTNLEKQLKGAGVNLRGITTFVGIALLVLLILDLFIYRGVPASRIAAAGTMRVGQALSLEAFPRWLEPLGQGVNYLALVWHATTLGILIGALFLSMVPGFLTPVLGGKGLKAHLAGAALAVPQPFCSCCSAPIGAALYRSGVALGPTLAFVVSSPMLNPTALILATVLLPGDFALLRIAGGLVVGVFLTYAVSLAAARWASLGPIESRPNRWMELSARIMDRYTQWFRFEAFLTKRPAESPADLVSTWLGLTWALARVVVPVLLVGSMVTASVVMALPSPNNDLPGVIVAAAFGTMLMVPTWTEIPIAAELMRQGLTGPAATLLLTLPAVSIPCLLIVGGATHSLRVPLLLGLLVFLAGVVAGALFL